MDDEQRPNWRVSRGIRTRARTLRETLTDAERRLWGELRGHRLGGLSFRRQFPVGPYVVDFVCLPAGLVIEVDGGQHYEPAGQAKDQRRDLFLADKGFTVLRFSNLDVLNTMSGVLETISAAATGGLPPPQPSPASGRGGQGWANDESPLPLAAEGLEGAKPRSDVQAAQDKDHPR
ncbi:endonuclease domain-containing protein [Xanthobacter autotrophicus]|uniref:endonuclease domain-containing protein n=1 Tax=Xanthobacter autotrophicus TaxID=280 RepID=UPI00372CB8B7